MNQGGESLEWHKDGTIWRWTGVEGVEAWFSTRQGGVSSPPFDSMNLSFNVNDDTESVIENRSRILAHGGVQLSDLVMSEQVHKAGVVWVDKSHRGRGAEGPTTALPGMDGLLTESRHVVLGMGFADCVPIFLADAKRRYVGALHAGWRGTILGVQIEALRMIEEHWGTLKDLRVGIGPSIGPCCYEVDETVYQAVVGRLGHDRTLKAARPGHWQLDLWQTNKLIIENAGVPTENINIAGQCTSCQADEFFSHRRDRGRTGRMGGYICLTSS